MIGWDSETCNSTAACLGGWLRLKARPMPAYAFPVAVLNEAGEGL